MRLKYYPDLYSATFFSLTNFYKWKYKLNDDIISTLIFESYFLMLTQMALAFLLVAYGFADNFDLSFFLGEDESN